MKLSIITINYNNVNGLKKTIDSIVNQTWRDFEWIIIDGGSTDGSKELIEGVAAYSRNNISYWCSEPDKGIYNAMNKGIEKAKGEWLNFMNSGDGFYEEETLIKVFGCERFAFEIGIADVLYGDAVFFNESKVWDRNYSDKLSFSEFVYSNINHQSSFYKRSVFEGGMYDEKYSLLADLKMNIQCLMCDKKFVHLSQKIALYDATGLTGQGDSRTITERSLIFKELLPEQLIVDITDLANLKLVNEYVLKKEDQIIDSWTYRVGKFFMAPYRLWAFIKTHIFR